jgi:hypothetical protein
MVVVVTVVMVDLRERENKIERETKGGLNLEESRLYYLSTLFLFHHFLSTKQNLCNFLTLLHYF